MHVHLSQICVTTINSGYCVETASHACLLWRWQTVRIFLLCAESHVRRMRLTRPDFELPPLGSVAGDDAAFTRVEGYCDRDSSHPLCFSACLFAPSLSFSLFLSSLLLLLPPYFPPPSRSHIHSPCSTFSLFLLML